MFRVGGLYGFIWNVNTAEIGSPRVVIMQGYSKFGELNERVVLFCSRSLIQLKSRP